LLTSIILKRISARQRPTAHLDVFAHPDASLRRWETYPYGKRAKMLFLDERQLKQLGVKIYKNTGITFLPNEYSPLLLITGHCFPVDKPFRVIVIRT
jgi:hypothetical protein